MSEQVVELTPQQIIIRDIAESYLSLQQNTEYLTHVLRFQYDKNRPVYTAVAQSINIKSFFLLIVQTSYLLYSCKIHKIVIMFSKKLFLNKVKNQVEIIRQFLLESEFLKMSEWKRKQIQDNFEKVNVFKHDNAYTEYVVNIVQLYMQEIKVYLDQFKERKIKPDRVVERQIQYFFAMLRVIIPQLNNLTPHKLIRCLEETQVFKKYSLILKALNCSIFQSLQNNNKFNQNLMNIKQKQSNLIKKYDLMYRENAFDQCDKIIQESFEDLILWMVKEQILEIDVSYENNSLQSKIGETDMQAVQKKTTWRIKVLQKQSRKFTKQFLKNNNLSDPLEKMERMSEKSSNKRQEQYPYLYFILDLEFQKKLMFVGYVSNIQANSENSDALLFHCNNIMNEWNNVSMELLYFQKNAKQKQRFVTFKMMSFLNTKSQPFINFLLMIDQAMIYGKVLEEYLIKDPIKLDDYQNFAQARNKINHLMSLFNKKARIVYEKVKLKH